MPQAGYWNRCTRANFLATASRSRHCINSATAGDQQTLCFCPQAHAVCIHEKEVNISTATSPTPPRRHAPRKISGPVHEHWVKHELESGKFLKTKQPLRYRCDICRVKHLWLQYPVESDWIKGGRAIWAVAGRGVAAGALPRGVWVLAAGKLERLRKQDALHG